MLELQAGARSRERRKKTSYLNQMFEEDLESSNIEGIPQDANHSSVVRIGRQDFYLQRSTEMSHKSSGTKFYGLMRPRLNSTKVMEKCGERRDLLIIQNIQPHL